MDSPSTTLGAYVMITGSSFACQTPVSSTAILRRDSDLNYSVIEGVCADARRMLALVPVMPRRGITGSDERHRHHEQHTHWSTIGTMRNLGTADAVCTTSTTGTIARFLRTSAHTISIIVKARCDYDTRLPPA
nr:hypothetical protein CFP56_36223 [Quercus suber]